MTCSAQRSGKQPHTWKPNGCNKCPRTMLYTTILRATCKEESSFWWASSEAVRCTFFFLRRTGARGKTLPMTEAYLPDDAITINQNYIITTPHAFWSNASSAYGDGSEHPPPPIDWKPLLDSIRFTLSDQEWATLDTHLTAEETSNVIKSLPQHNSTELGGLRGEIVQLHVEKWANILAAVFKTVVHSHSQLPLSFRSSVLKLLYNKERRIIQQAISL